MAMRLYLDADSVPRRHREIILRRVIGKDVDTFFVADRRLPDVEEAIALDKAERRRPLRDRLSPSEVRKIPSRITLVVVESGENSGDDKLVEIAQAPGMAVTHDIPLAARLLEKGLSVIDDRGGEYTSITIRARLQERENNRSFRELGVFTGRQQRFDERTVREFASAFDRVYSRLEAEEKSCP